MAAWAAEKSAEVALVAPADWAAAMAWRASLISCTGALAHPARQATPINTARKRSIAFCDTSNSRQGRQTSRRYTMRGAARRIRCADAADAHNRRRFPGRLTMNEILVLYYSR